MTSLCDVMRISRARKGWSYIRRAGPNLGAVVTVIWVFQDKALGFVNKPQTLYLSCISSPQGGSITRMDIATYLSICMHPDLSGGLLVSTILVVCNWADHYLPPLNVVLSEVQITTLW